MYRDLVKLQDGERQPGTGYNLIVATLVFLAGIISAMILCPGCNSAIQLANGIGKDMQVAGAGVQAMTDKQKDIGAFSYTRPEIDSMMLDKEGF